MTKIRKGDTVHVAYVVQGVGAEYVDIGQTTNLRKTQIVKHIPREIIIGDRIMTKNKSTVFRVKGIDPIVAEYWVRDVVDGKSMIIQRDKIVAVL